MVIGVPKFLPNQKGKKKSRAKFKDPDILQSPNGKDKERGQNLSW